MHNSIHTHTGTVFLNSHKQNHLHCVKSETEESQDQALNEKHLIADTGS